MTSEFWQQPFTPQDIDFKENTVEYAGYYQVRRLTYRHKRFDGGWTEYLTREQLVRRDAVSAILWDPKQDKVVLVEQLRVGLIGNNEESTPWMVEVIAGLIDHPESPETAVRREAKEETGCEIRTLIPIGAFYNSPGGFTEKTYVFCGLIELGELPLVNQPEEDEDLKIHIVDWAKVKQVWQTGWVSSSTTLVALQWLDHHHDALKQEALKKPQG